MLALCLVLSHLPAPLAAPGAPGALVCSSAAPGWSEVVLDDCCGPTPVVKASETCCGPTADAAASDEGGEPCCPSGCKHCPRSCCSPPLALISRGVDFAIQLVAAPQAESPLPVYTSATLGGVFHPPRG